MLTILKSINDQSFCHWPGWRIWVPGQEIRPCSGSGPHNLVDLSLQLRGQLLQQLQGSERVFQLSSCPGSNESRVEILVLQTPSNGEVGQFEAKFLCDSRDFLEFVDGLVSGVLVVEKLLGELKGEPEGGIVGPDNLILRHSIEILSCEETPSKRTPSNQTILVNLEQLLVFNF